MTRCAYALMIALVLSAAAENVPHFRKEPARQSERVASATGVVGNDLVEQDQLIVFRQTERSASGIAAYPLNRAERVELQAGLTQISFDEVVQTTVFSLTSGQVLSNDTTTTG